MRKSLKVGTWAVLGAGLLTASASADEAKIPLGEVPKPVMAAFKAKFPKATIKNAIKEEEAGKVTYEIESLVEGDMSIDAVLKPDGEFVAIERQIKPSALPANATSVAKEKYPTGTVSKAEEVTSEGTISYEVTVKKADGKSVVLLFDKAGKFLKQE